jgi:hypothetical protein
MAFRVVELQFRTCFAGALRIDPMEPHNYKVF